MPATLLTSLADDIVLPFQIEDLGIRGRVVRLGPLVDHVITRHNYPEPVSRLLGEAIVLTVMIGSALKFDGRFTLQTQSDGPVNMLVADFETADENGVSHVRGYAQLNEARLKDVLGAGQTSSHEILGDGYLALTIRQGENLEPYQGIVKLDAEGLSHSAHEYFANSEQIATRIRLAAGSLYTRKEDGHGETSWRAGAIMIQHIPPEGGHESGGAGGMTGHRESEDDKRPLTEEEENWNRASILLGTVEDHELLDSDLAPARLLYRLFHEDGVRAYEPARVEFGCHCSPERMSMVLQSFGEQEIDEMSEKGVIEVTCEFCSTQYRLDPAQLKEGL